MKKKLDKAQAQAISKLISVKGEFKRICVDGILDHADVLSNPTANGFWGHHANYGPCLVITMGPNKGMWLSTESLFCPGGPNHWRNLVK